MLRLNEKTKNIRIACGIIVFILLLIAQILLGKAGHSIANIIPCNQIDSCDAFLKISIHHAVEMIIAIIIIAVLSKLLKLDFYFKLGDVKKGTKFLAVFTAVFAAITIGLQILMYFTNRLPDYAFPLNAKNIIGTLAFQLFLSGPSEEIIFRALPITMLIFSFGKSVSIKGSFTLEVLLASILFSFAHINWSFIPFVFEVNYFQLFYSFALGTIQGIVYQKCKSLLYPILMHSFSNVLMVGIGYLFKILL